MKTRIYVIIETQINKNGNVFSYVLQTGKSKDDVLRIVKDYRLAVKHIYHGTDISFDEDKIELQFYRPFSEITSIVRVSETEI